MGTALLGAMLLVGACQNTSVPHSSDDAWRWAEEYGGAPAGYATILASEDCDALAADFHQDAAATGADVPGSAADRATVGFMTARRARMVELACSDIPPEVPGT